jgi:hypothetical protein
VSTVGIQDLSGSGTIDLGEASLFKRLGLTNVVAQTKDLVAHFERPLNDPGIVFKSASLQLKLTVPMLPTGPDTLKVAFSQTASLTMMRADPKSAASGDNFSLDVPLESGQIALALEIGATLTAGGAVKIPSGFGVSISDTAQATFATNVIFDANAAAAITFLEAITRTFADFSVSGSVPDVSGQPVGTLNTCTLQGTVTVGGSWTMPLSVSPSALAQANIPVTISLAPVPDLALQGTIAVAGTYSIHCWKQTESLAVVSVYKKRGTEFSVNFVASLGLTAASAGVDLIKTVFSAVAPGVDTSVLGDHADAVANALRECVNRSLSMCLNASCSATVGDEAALVYNVPTSTQDDAVNRALDAALHGDWRPLAVLPAANPVRNVLGSTRQGTAKFIVNLLGIYDFETTTQFIQSSVALHSFDDGSLTLTDTATAKRITVADTPFRADPDRLRQALAQANICSAAYAFALKGNSANIGVKQDLLIYKPTMDRAALRKSLKAGTALAFITNQDIEAATSSDGYRHVMLHAAQNFAPEVAQSMFFSDAHSLTPRDTPELRALGRAILSSLLDTSQDQARLEALASGWSDEQEPPAGPLRTDHLTVVQWAEAVHNVAKPLAEVLSAFAKIPAGQDASKNQDFTSKRNALKSALENVSKATNAGFEPAWPLAIMYALSRNRSGGSFTATWNGDTPFKLERAQVPSISSFAQ